MWIRLFDPTIILVELVDPLICNGDPTIVTRVKGDHSTHQERIRDTHLNFGSKKMCIALRLWGPISLKELSHQRS